MKALNHLNFFGLLTDRRTKLNQKQAILKTLNPQQFKALNL